MSAAPLWVIAALVAAILITMLGAWRKAFIGGALVALLVFAALLVGERSSSVSSLADLDLVEARRLVAMMQEERGLTEVRCDATMNRATIARSYWNSAPARTRPKITLAIARVCLADAGNGRTFVRDEAGETLEYRIEVR